MSIVPRSLNERLRNPAEKAVAVEALRGGATEAEALDAVLAHRDRAERHARVILKPGVPIATGPSDLAAHVKQYGPW